MTVLEVMGLQKSFGENLAVNDVSFTVKEGQIISILGPSGCGKSTILMMIAGLEKPDSGDILWKGSSILDIPPHRRGFGLMFQDYALFPHLNVMDNISFGLKYSGVDKSVIPERVNEILSVVNLEGFELRDVNTLSGGEQQRVALGRSLAPNPQLLMLDEPLGSIDRSLRDRLLSEIRGILRRLGLTAIYVTHDQEEAFSISDQVILMSKGRVEQIGSPQEIYRNPADVFVAKFLGFTNLLNGRIISSNTNNFIQTTIGDIPIDRDVNGAVTVLIRPETSTIGQSKRCQLSGRVVSSSFRGASIRVVITTPSIINNNSVNLTFEFPANENIPAVGEEIIISFDPNDTIQIFKKDQELIN